MQPVNAIVFIGDGVFQGAADFQYLALSMCVACALASLGMLTLDQSLASVWMAILLLQVGRAASAASRYLNLVPLAGPSPLNLKSGPDV